MSFIRLIRFPNLVIILFTQYMIRYALLYPFFKAHGFSLQLPESIFFIFSFAFVCMAAGGYIINDYYDVKADNINKPGKVIVGNSISPNMALLMYWVFTIAGISLGCWAATQIGLPMLGLLFFFYASGLWFYTTSFKYVFLMGNLLVSLFIAFVPFTAGFVELYAGVTRGHTIHTDIDFSMMLKVISAISIFSFLITLARELVKDMEDVEGDEKAGCRTLPIVWGTDSGKKTANFVLIIILALLSYILFAFWKAHLGWAIAYIVGLIQIPILICMININKVTIPTGFHKISNWLKLIMVSGICFLFLSAYICLH
jgi:4-hydroxybenzoate polyprenyltransferase